MEKVYNTQFFHTVLMFLTMVSANLSSQIRTDLATDPTKIKIEDQTLYIRKEINGGGTQKLLSGSTERIPGICSFDKNRLENGRVFIFDGIAINYKSDAASGKEGTLEYTSKAPAPLQNADFVITQNGIEVLRLPVRDLHNIGTGQTVLQDYTELKTFRYLNDVHTIEMNFEFPDGSSLDAATKHYVQVRLRGVQTKKA